MSQHDICKLPYLGHEGFPYRLAYRQQKIDEAKQDFRHRQIPELTHLKRFKNKWPSEGLSTF